MYKLICVAYIAVITGMAISSVGDMPKTPAEPFTGSLVLLMFLLLVIPAVLGYLAGKDDDPKRKDY